MGYEGIPYLNDKLIFSQSRQNQQIYNRYHSYMNSSALYRMGNPFLLLNFARYIFTMCSFSNTSLLHCCLCPKQRVSKQKNKKTTNWSTSLWTPTMLKLIRPAVAKLFFKQDDYKAQSKLLVNMHDIKLLILFPNPFSQAQKPKRSKR